MYAEYVFDPTNFSYDIVDPMDMDGENFIQGVSYVGIPNDTKKFHTWLSNRMKLFFQILMNADVCIQNLEKTKFLTDLSTNISKKMNAQLVYKYDRPNIYYSGIKHESQAWLDVIEQTFTDTAPKLGESQLTLVYGLKFYTYGWVACDQFTSFFINNSFQRMLKNRLQMRNYHDLIRLNMSRSLTLLTNNENNLDAFGFIYKPTDDDLDAWLFIYTLDNRLFTEYLRFMIEQTESRNIFSIRSVSHLSNLQSSDTSALMSALIIHTSTLSSGATINNFLQAFFMDIFTDRFDINLDVVNIGVGTTSFVTYFFYLVTAVLFPKLFWRLAVPIYEQICIILQQTVSKTFNTFVSNHGFYSEFKQNRWVKAHDRKIITYDEYRSGIVPSLFVQQTRNSTNVLYDIYKLIKPLGGNVNLVNKQTYNGKSLNNTPMGYLTNTPIDVDDDYFSATDGMTTRLAIIKDHVMSVRNLSNRDVVKTSNKDNNSAFLFFNHLNNYFDEVNILYITTLAPIRLHIMNTYGFVYEYFNYDEPWIQPHLIGVTNENESLCYPRAIIGYAKFSIHITAFTLMCISGLFNRSELIINSATVTAKAAAVPDKLIGPFNPIPLVKLYLKGINYSKRICFAFKVYELVYKSENLSKYPMLKILFSNIYSRGTAREYLRWIHRYLGVDLLSIIGPNGLSEKLDVRFHKFKIVFVNRHINSLAISHENENEFNIINKYIPKCDKFDLDNLDMAMKMAFDEESILFDVGVGLVIGVHTLINSSHITVFDNPLHLKMIKYDPNFTIIHKVAKEKFNIGSYICYCLPDLAFVGNGVYNYDNLDDLIKYHDFANDDIPKHVLCVDRLTDITDLHQPIILELIKIGRVYLKVEKMKYYANVVPITNRLHVQDHKKTIEDMFKMEDIGFKNIILYDTSFLFVMNALASTALKLHTGVLPLKRSKNRMLYGRILGDKVEQNILQPQASTWCAGEPINNDETNRTYPGTNIAKTDSANINFNNLVPVLTDNVILDVPDVIFSANRFL